jgi:hypothetical protein
MSRVYNAPDLKRIHSIMDEIRDKSPHTPAPAAPVDFTCWRGDCKLHDDCIHSYDQEYPPCVDAAVQQAARTATLATLDDICENCGGLADGGEQCKGCYVKSLRQQQGGE